jgi:hypothetical protein
MIKYKLIKEYPGSPKIGQIVTKKKPLENPNGFYTEKGVLSIVDNPENYPEFWEKVVEKDYEILSFIQNSQCKDLWKKCSSDKWARFNGNHFITIPYSTEEMLNSSWYKIHSIKRLSDSQIFTVGDNTTTGVIEAFEFDSNKNLYFKVSNLVGGFYNYNLSLLKKIKKPLFTTEDGIDIYEGDTIHQIRLETFDYHSYIWGTINGKNGIPFDGFKMFSIKEKAEEYILENKPCLSIKDVKYYLDNHRTFGKDYEAKQSFINKLKELAVNKI